MVFSFESAAVFKHDVHMHHYRSQGVATEVPSHIMLILLIFLHDVSSVPIGCKVVRQCNEGRVPGAEKYVMGKGCYSPIELRE